MGGLDGSAGFLNGHVTLESGAVLGAEIVAEHAPAVALQNRIWKRLPSTLPHSEVKSNDPTILHDSRMKLLALSEVVPPASTLAPRAIPESSPRST